MTEPDWAAVLDDLGSGELTAAYRRAVADAIPDGVVIPAEFWEKLSYAVVDYFVRTLVDEDLRPRKFILESMREISRLIDKLAGELRLIRQVPLDPLDASSRLFWALGPAKAEVDRHLDRYGRMIAASRGHNPHQQQLYSTILQLWCHDLGQGLRYSKKGPLVRFFITCVGPILGDSTPTGGIGDIVDREKRRYLGRTHTDSESKK